jgi:hypothetical protein
VRALDLGGHSDRRLDECRQRRWPISIAMPHHDQHAWRHRFGQLHETNLRVVLIDCQQRRQRNP